MSVTFKRDFWPHNPTLWFLHCEIILSEYEVTDEERFKLVADKLPDEVKRKIKDLLEYPPLTDKYKTLKSRIISEYQDDPESIKPLQQTPSAILLFIKYLAFTYKVEEIEEDPLIEIWIQYLPEPVREVLTFADALSIETQVSMADKIVKAIESSKPKPNLNPVKACKLQQEVARLTDQVLQLKRIVQEKSECHNAHCCNQSTPSSSIRKIEYKQTEPDNSNVVCRYHEKFGDKAYSCQLPCNFGRLKNKSEEEVKNAVPDEVAAFDFIMRFARTVDYA